MHQRSFGLELAAIGATLALTAGWSCSNSSGTPGNAPDGAGGATSSTTVASGGATLGLGGTAIGDAPKGGATSSGGQSSQPNWTTTGGSVATGGKAAQGGASVALGGTVATGGKSAQDGTLVAMGGAAPTGGKSSTGGMTTSRSNTGGAPGSGGATGKSETTGGTNASGGNTSVGTTSAAGGPTSVTCPKTALKIGDNTQTITSAGKSRTFIVRLPTGYTGSAAIPAIIDFHPLGGSGSGQEGSSGWKAKCDSVGCISVYPDSVAGDNPASWNAGYCCDGAEKNQTDDVSFARDIVKWLIANTCVDAKRIYASGGSNGGGMTYRMACEASDVIAAVAPVDFRCVTGTDPLANGGKLTASNNTACSCPRLNRPITVVAWDEGADTSIVPYAGGQTPQLTTDCPPSGSCVGIGFTSAQVNAETWASYNKCTGSPTTDPDNSLCKTWTNCEGNTTVSLCTTTSGGHLSVYGSSAKWTDMAWNKLKTQSLP